MTCNDFSFITEFKPASFDDKVLTFRISQQLDVYILFLHSDYKYLTNFLKYRYGIIVRQGYVICNNNLAVVYLLLLSDVPYSHIIFKKGAF